MYFDKVYYLGPAAIDRFSLSDGILKKKATFSDPSAYRFTTHKVFHFNGKTYICSFGQPNRLFLIDAENMRVVHFHDIGRDVISANQDGLLNYLNNAETESITIKTIEVSPDGRYLFLLAYNYIYIYDMAERKIVESINYQPDLSLGGSLSLADFYKKTTHVDYL